MRCPSPSPQETRVRARKTAYRTFSVQKKSLTAYVEEQLDAGKDVLLEIEIQGALQVKEKRPDTLLVFITPPTAEELERRLRGRGTETEEVIKGRMERAKEEAQGMDQYDYVLINDDLETCVKQMHETIQSQHFMSSNQKDFIEQMKKSLEK